MKYILIQYGNGTQMVKVLSETPKKLTVLRFDCSRAMWWGKTSPLKSNDGRIIQEMSLSEAIIYAEDRCRKARYICRYDGLTLRGYDDAGKRSELTQELIVGIMADFEVKVS